MKRGVDSLATIASIALLPGLSATVHGIVGSFVGCGGEKWTCLAAVVDRLSSAIAASALGLIVGILLLLCYRYLLGRVEALDVEMKNVTLELANALATLLKSA